MTTLDVLGRVAYYGNDPVAARSLGEESLAVARTLPDDWLAAWAFHLLGLSGYHQGDYATADARSLESLLTLRAVGTNWTLGVAFAVIATIAAQTEMVRAVRIAGAMRRLCEWLTPPPMPMSEAAVVEALDRARDVLDEATFAAAWARGQAMSLVDVTAETLAVRAPR